LKGRSFEGLRALIVDDNAVNRKILHNQAAAWRMTDTEAENGRAALEVIRAEAARGRRFDLALVDVLMPEMDGLSFAQALRADSGVGDLPLIVMTSGGMERQADFRNLGVKAFLTKPIRQNQLYNAIAEITLSARKDAGVTTSPATLPASSASGGGPAAGPKLLVVEDNPANQKVILLILKGLGYAADLAENGADALTLLERNTYPLILMDCQMPVMDGYQATSEIRRRGGNGSRVPVIAMTANVMSGAREKCLEWGMNDYISKPIDRNELKRTLEKWLAAEARSGGETQKPA
jgi:CheY-like chemotaxis protein